MDGKVGVKVGSILIFFAPILKNSFSPKNVELKTLSFLTILTILAGDSSSWI